MKGIILIILFIYSMFTNYQNFNFNKEVIDETQSIVQNDIVKKQKTETKVIQQETSVKDKTTKPKNTETNQITKQESTQQVTKPAVNTPQVENPPQVTNSTPTIPSSEPVIEASPTQEKKYEEKYVVNNEMIEKIKQAIINNESEAMKQYGYTIVVDSSIKSLTNPFTFSETRLQRLLPHKSGTIRIYAEDYYVNGEYIMTDSYVI